MTPGLPVFIVVSRLIAFFIHDLLRGAARDGRLTLCSGQALLIVRFHPDFTILVRDLDGGAVAVVLVVNSDLHFSVLSAWCRKGREKKNEVRISRPDLCIPDFGRTKPGTNTRPQKTPRRRGVVFVPCPYCKSGSI